MAAVWRSTVLVVCACHASEPHVSSTAVTNVAPPPTLRVVFEPDTGRMSRTPCNLSGAASDAVRDAVSTALRRRSPVSFEIRALSREDTSFEGATRRLGRDLVNGECLLVIDARDSNGNAVLISPGETEFYCIQVDSSTHTVLLRKLFSMERERGYPPLSKSCRR